MLSNRKKRSSASATRWKVLEQQVKEYTVEDVVKLVSISFLEATAKIDMVDDKNAKKIIEHAFPINFPPTAICTN